MNIPKKGPRLVFKNLGKVNYLFTFFIFPDGDGDPAPPEVQGQAAIRPLPQGHRPVDGGSHQVFGILF